MKNEHLKRLVDEGIQSKRAKLYCPFIPVSNLTELAIAYHFESDWYKRIALRWVRGGVIASIVITIAIFWLNKAITAAKVPELVWVSINVLTCIIVLYVIQLIGKQIVASREIVYALSERAKFVQAVKCAIKATKDPDQKKVLFENLISQVAVKLPSPFEKEKVAGKANYDFIKDLAAILKK